MKRKLCRHGRRTWSGRGERAVFDGVQCENEARQTKHWKTPNRWARQSRRSRGYGWACAAVACEVFFLFFVSQTPKVNAFFLSSPSVPSVSIFTKWQDYTRRRSPPGRIPNSDKQSFKTRQTEKPLKNFASSQSGQFAALLQQHGSQQRSFQYLRYRFLSRCKSADGVTFKKLSAASCRKHQTNCFKSF